MCPMQCLGVQYAKPWHSDIRSCCHQSVHALTYRYDSTLLDCTFATPKTFLHEISLAGIIKWNS